MEAKNFNIKVCNSIKLNYYFFANTFVFLKIHIPIKIQRFQMSWMGAQRYLAAPLAWKETFQQKIFHQQIICFAQKCILS